MKTVWEYLVRLRTYIVNILYAVLIVAPDMFNSPEILALFPPEWARYVVAAAFLTNIWLRPRPAVIPSDPEVDMRKARAGR